MKLYHIMEYYSFPGYILLYNINTIRITVYVNKPIMTRNERSYPHCTELESELNISKSH